MEGFRLTLEINEFEVSGLVDPYLGIGLWVLVVLKMSAEEAIISLGKIFFKLFFL